VRRPFIENNRDFSCPGVVGILQEFLDYCRRNTDSTFRHLAQESLNSTDDVVLLATVTAYSGYDCHRDQPQHCFLVENVTAPHNCLRAYVFVERTIWANTRGPTIRCRILPVHQAARPK